MKDCNRPREMWEALRSEMLKRIREIDNETPWSEREPKWWLEMTSVERALWGLTDREAK